MREWVQVMRRVVDWWSPKILIVATLVTSLVAVGQLQRLNTSLDVQEGNNRIASVDKLSTTYGVIQQREMDDPALYTALFTDVPDGTAPSELMVALLGEVAPDLDVDEITSLDELDELLWGAVADPRAGGPPSNEGRHRLRAVYLHAESYINFLGTVGIFEDAEIIGEEEAGSWYSILHLGRFACHPIVLLVVRDAEAGGYLERPVRRELLAAAKDRETGCEETVRELHDAVFAPGWLD